MNKTKQLIEDLKKEIEKRKKLLNIPYTKWKSEFKEENDAVLDIVEVLEQTDKYQAQLQFAEKLIKAIKEDVDEWYGDGGIIWDYIGSKHKGIIFKDKWEQLNKILDEALK